LRQRYPNPRNLTKAHGDVRRRTTVTERAHVLHGIAELLSRDRKEDAKLWGKRTGKPLYRARVDATVTTRYFAFYGSTLPFLKDTFGSRR
jgi:acyl-CoA reductase-like NAD-dependent aldehyde dehydrogenase